MKSSIIPVALAVASFLAPAAVQAQVLVPTEETDGRVRDGLYASKDGVGDDAVTSGTVLQLVHTSREDLPFEDRVIIEFDITGVPAFDQAQLRLYTNASGGALSD